MDECQQAFYELKLYLSWAPILSRPVPETLYMYLAMIDHAVSAVLLNLDQGVQKPIFYVSKTLIEAETCYLPLEKVELGKIHVVRRLPHYFQAYTVVVQTEHPLQALLRRSNFKGMIAKWRAFLGAFDIQYRPQTSIKGQVLVDFVAEFTPEQAKVLKIEGSKTMEAREQIW